MRSRTFKGGIHPYDGKDLTRDKPRIVLEPKGLLVYPVAQHLGAPAKPVVDVGDRVLVGQKIAEAGGYISSCVIASVSGTVRAIEPRLTVGGNDVLSIVIENDDAYTSIDGFGIKRNYKGLSKEGTREIVKEAGIVGLGGAGFPTIVKITPKNQDHIDTIIINAAECEPYLTSDYRMMMEVPDRIITGLGIVLSLFGNARGVIAIEDNKPDAIRVMQGMVANEENMSVSVVRTKYPQGGERTLIYAVTGRQINSSMLPADAGCIVLNVATTEAIYMAVAESTPLIYATMTVTGDAVVNPQNFIVRTGTNYAELVDAAGGFVRNPTKLISGGPMMGVSLYTLDVPVVKTSSAILAYLEDASEDMEPGPCIRCGKCLSVCPSSIAPQKMMELSEDFDEKGFEGIKGMECFECGACTYICPARRRLTQSFKQMRSSILARRK